MMNKPLDKISLDDLSQLKVNAVTESKTIEYKKKLPTNSDGDRKEFLADISSFANASGGDLIFGITENGGVPQDIEGVDIENVDEEVGKYENLIRNGIEPRVTISTQSIKISEKKHVLIFRIGKSWNGPNRVVYKGHDKFYSRHSTGKYSLDTAELRIAFTFSQTLTEKITKFKTERIARLYEGEMPIQFCKGAKIVLHLIPLESFNPNYYIDLKSIIESPRKLKPIYSSICDLRINLEGVLSYSRVQPDMAADSYVQLYRNGIFESVESSILNAYGHGKVIPSSTYEKELLASLREYLTLSKELGVNMPIVIFLTLIGIKGWQMSRDRNVFHAPRQPILIDREILQLPETLVESYDTEPEDILRPIFDRVWNACGYERSDNFDEDGHWTKQ